MNKIICPILSITVRKAILFRRISEKPNKKSPAVISVEDSLFLLILQQGTRAVSGALLEGSFFYLKKISDSDLLNRRESHSESTTVVAAVGGTFAPTRRTAVVRSAAPAAAA